MKTIILIICILFNIAGSALCEETWECFTNSNDIQSISIQGDYIWCGTWGGVVRWNRLDETYKKYTISEGLANNEITELAIDGDRNIWTSRFKGSIVSKFDGTSWKNHIENEIPVLLKVKSMIVDNNNVTWAGTYGGGIAKITGNDWEIYTTEDGLISNSVNVCSVDHSDVKWFGTKSGVSCYNDTKWVNYTTDDGLIADEVISIAIDHNNIKWFGTKRGVSSFDGTTWISYTSDNKLPNNNIMTIAIDEENIKWFGSSDGLVRYDGNTWFIYTNENSELPDNYVKEIKADPDGVLWLSTGLSTYVFVGNGLTRFDGVTWKTYKTKGPVNNIIMSVAVDKNNVKWFGAIRGISSFDGNTWKEYTDINGHDIGGINDIFIDANNIVRFGGSISYDGMAWTLHNHENTLPQILNMRTYDVDKKGIEWIATRDSALWSFNGETWTNYTRKEGLINNNVLSITVDKNNIKWFGMKSGVSSFDEETWKNYNSENGFVDDMVLSSAIDTENTKWFGTWGSGLWSFDDILWRSYKNQNSKLYDNHIHKVFVFNDVLWIISGMGTLQSFDGNIWYTFDGIDSFNAGQVKDIALDSKNTLWFGTYENGVLRYYKSDISSIKEKVSVPETLIILGNYPNPFNPATTITYTLTSSDFASLVIYNIMGQKVRELVSEAITPGVHSVTWDGKDDIGNPVSSGVYISRLKMDSHIATGRMLLMK